MPLLELKEAGSGFLKNQGKNLKNKQ